MRGHFCLTDIGSEEDVGRIGFEDFSTPAWQYISYLIIHNNFVSSCVQQGCLSKQLPFQVFILLPVGLLYIVGRQGIKGFHLIPLTVSIVQPRISSGTIQDFDKVINVTLLVVFQLKEHMKITKVKSYISMTRQSDCYVRYGNQPRP